jgi:hypothetical protein
LTNYLFSFQFLDEPNTKAIDPFASPVSQPQVKPPPEFNVCWSNSCEAPSAKINKKMFSSVAFTTMPTTTGQKLNGFGSTLAFDSFANSSISNHNDQWLKLTDDLAKSFAVDAFGSNYGFGHDDVNWAVPVNDVNSPSDQKPQNDGIVLIFLIIDKMNYLHTGF